MTIAEMFRQNNDKGEGFEPELEYLKPYFKYRDDTGIDVYDHIGEIILVGDAGGPWAVYADEDFENLEYEERT